MMVGKSEAWGVNSKRLLIWNDKTLDVMSEAL